MITSKSYLINNNTDLSHRFHQYTTPQSAQIQHIFSLKFDRLIA